MKVLFVCLGNICRSPAGENILRHSLKQAKHTEQWTIDSAGTEAWHSGKAPDSRMTQTLLNRGVEVTGTARQISQDDLAYFDLVLTMDNENYANVNKLDPQGFYAAKIHKFTSFCTQHRESEVPDPYYGGQDGFELVADLLEDGCEKIVSKYAK